MRRLVLLLSILLILDLAMFSAIVPLLPRYADTLGLSKPQVGLLVAAYSAAVVTLAVPVGHLADRVGMRRMTMSGSLLMAAATVALALAGSFPVLVGARIAQGTAGAIAWSAGLAWLAARAPAERRGTYIGWANAAATGGVIAGPLVGGVVTSHLGIRTTFLAAAGISLGLAAWASLEQDGDHSARPRESVRRALRAALAERLIAVSVCVVALVALVGGVLQVLMPLHLGAQGVSRDRIGVYYSVGALLGAMAIALTGRVGDRIGRVPVAIAACAVLGGGIAVLLLPLGALPFAAMLVALAPVQSVMYGVGYPLGADGAEAAHLGHGLVMGVVNLAWGLGAVVGPVAGATLAHAASDRASYAGLVLTCLAAALAIRRTTVARAPA
ncbi:MAG: MFS transporter [Gaiellales bacterium]